MILDVLIINALLIVVALAIWLWAKRQKEQRHFSDMTTVTITAGVALLCSRLSHFSIDIKLIATLLSVAMWLLAYRFREQGPVVGAVLVGLAAIMILSGLK